LLHFITNITNMYKTVAVTGATGQQGGSVVRALAQHNAAGADAEGDVLRFRVRALVRDPAGSKAQALLQLGGNVELVQADYDQPETLGTAFHGADYAYVVTDWWSTYSATIEKAQAEAVANACKEAGVQFVVWSTLEDTRKFLAMDAMPVLDPSGKHAYVAAHQLKH
jgi:uncharacterized protein YbjT (DUF2867 family)